MRPSFEGAFRAVRSYAVGSVHYNGFSSRTGTTFPSSGRKRPGFFTAQGTPSLSQSLALPLILGARSCGHPPRKHNLKSHLAAHANPALEAQTALWCGRPPTKTRALLHTCRGHLSVVRPVQARSQPRQKGRYVRSAARLAFGTPFMKEPGPCAPLGTLLTLAVPPFF